VPLLLALLMQFPFKAVQQFLLCLSLSLFLLELLPEILLTTTTLLFLLLL